MSKGRDPYSRVQGLRRHARCRNDMPREVAPAVMPKDVTQQRLGVAVNPLLAGHYYRVGLCRFLLRRISKPGSRGVALFLLCREVSGQCSRVGAW